MPIIGNNSHWVCSPPGVTHILNVSRDIENFFERKFRYMRVDVLDRPDQNLLEHWQKTYDFIKSCKERNGKVGDLDRVFMDSFNNCYAMKAE